MPPRKKGQGYVIISLGYKIERTWQRFILRRNKRGDLVMTIKRYINGKLVERQDLHKFTIQGAVFDRVMTDVNNRVNPKEEPKADLLERLKEVKLGIFERTEEKKVAE